MEVNLKRKSLAKEIALYVTAVVLAGMVIFIGYVYFATARQMKARITDDLRGKTVLARDMLSAFGARLEEETALLMPVFRSHFSRDFSLEPDRRITVGDFQVPALLSGGTLVNLNYQTVDGFTALTGAPATVFVRSGDNLVRITTSLKKEDGTRAIGTALSHDHPAYARIMAGDEYVGTAVLFGRSYITRYLPVKDRGGKVVGALFIGIDFTQSLQAIKEKIKAITIGKTGYIYALNAGPGPDQGTFAIHPTLEGQSGLEIKDAKGLPFIKQMLDTKEGVIDYWWNPANGLKQDGMKGAEEKEVVYLAFPHWNWILVSGATINELFTEVYSIRNKMIAGSLVFIAVLSFLLFRLINSLVINPLAKAVKMIGEMSLGHLGMRLKLGRKDEIGQLAETMDGFAEDLQNNVIHALRQVAAGDLTVRVKAKDSEDEITPALGKLIGTLHALNIEIAKLTKAGVDGTLGVRGNADKFQGGFRDAVEGINRTLDAVVGPLTMAAGYMDRISKGDIPPKITDNYNGDFNHIKNNLNVCIDTLNGLVEETRMLSAATVDGHLNTRGEAGKFAGSYREIVQGINATLDALVGPLTRTIVHLEHLSDGVVDEMITQQYKGDYIRLKESFNKCFTAINGLIAEAKMLSTSAVEGRLDTRGDAKKFQGGYRDIIAGFNETLDAAIKPVQEGVRVLEKMGRNDFTEYIASDYKGDHALIKNNINKVLDALNSSLKKVGEASGQVAATTQELSATAEQMSSGAQQQTAQTAQVATSMEEMSATIREVAKNSGAAAVKAQESGETAVKGGEIVAATVDGMGKIAASVKELQTVIGGLSRNSEKIGDIVGVIEDVADQTNLLALNAAIEAARAGEQGRGFAVVADEVRKLAERTTASTKEIAEMVASIQGDTSKAVNSMETSAKEVDAGVGNAQRAGEALQNIVQGTRAVQDMVQQIATAAEEQSAAADEISSNIESIASVSKQNASGAQQTAKASEDLAHLTESLQKLVEQFTIVTAGQHAAASAKPGAAAKFDMPS